MPVHAYRPTRVITRACDDVVLTVSGPCSREESGPTCGASSAELAAQGVFAQRVQFGDRQLLEACHRER